MSLLAQVFADVSFLDVMLSLIAVALIERALAYCPEDMVGDGGWLLDTGPAAD